MSELFAEVGEMVAAAERAAAAKADFRTGVAMSDSDGHVQVQLGAQIWTVSDPSGVVAEGDRVTVVSQDNHAIIMGNDSERAWWDAHPPGFTAVWWTSIPPTPRWWLMQGQAIDPGLYPACAALFGANLPDARDRYLIGASSSKSPRAIGGSASITTNNLPPHTHSYSASPDSSDANYYATLGGTGSYKRGDMDESTDTGSAGSGTDYWPRYLAGNLIVRMG